MRPTALRAVLGLWFHSLRVGVRAIRSGALKEPRTRRGVLNRLLVPMDAWRVWEFGAAVEGPFDGRCLDVSSPKLVTSYLAVRGSGRWVGVDLFEDEIALWRRLDPDLDLRIEDARDLGFEDGSFDHVLCVSVVEHIHGEGLARAMGELHRVLAPGGVLHLTTNIAPAGSDVFVDSDTWGEATEHIDGRVFFEHRFDDDELTALIGDGWEVLERRMASERVGLSAAFARLAPVSYVAGNLLPLLAPLNFRAVDRAADVRPPFGVVYLRLRRR